MPSTTFHKLSKTKRERFLQIARKEFSAHDYESASVSGIVKTLTIAKGSVYQYFVNKWDLYQYLVKEAHEKLLEIIQFVDDRSENDIHLWFVQRVMAEIKFGREFSDEFELLAKTRLSRSGRIAQLGASLINKEKTLITGAIERVETYKEKANKLAFITYAIKDTYLRELTYASLTNDQIIEQLTSFAKTIFGED